MLKIGSSAPDFTLPDQDGNTITLSEVLAQGPVLLYFYPADFTPGCTKEACMLRDAHADILDVGVTVIGVSAQDEDSHSKFQQQHNLPFTLLADTRHEVAELYDASGLFGVTKRITYLINQDGTIDDAVNAMFRISAHEELLNEALQRYSDS
ncbi:MAG: peroxiredoxin [Gammaproteobacteria bacterium]